MLEKLFGIVGLKSPRKEEEERKKRKAEIERLVLELHEKCKELYQRVQEELSPEGRERKKRAAFALFTLHLEDGDTLLLQKVVGFGQGEAMRAWLDHGTYLQTEQRGGRMLSSLNFPDEGSYIFDISSHPDIEEQIVDFLEKADQPIKKIEILARNGLGNSI